jgi:hypothetical protein
MTAGVGRENRRAGAERSAPAFGSRRPVAVGGAFDLAAHRYRIAVGARALADESEETTRDVFVKCGLRRKSVFDLVVTPEGVALIVREVLNHRQPLR